MRPRFFILSSIIPAVLGCTTAAHAASEVMPDRSKSAWIAFQMAQSAGSGNSGKGSSGMGSHGVGTVASAGLGAGSPGTAILGVGPGTSAAERPGGKPRLP